MSSAAPPGSPPTPDLEALIAAARRRQRRRRRLLVVFAAVALMVAAGGYLAFRTWPGGRQTAGGSRPSGSGRSAATIRLVWPSALALGPHGVLYIADWRRHQILARLPNGRFRVVAGTGKPGFSGDGGPAVRARLGMPTGMALGRDGTLYFGDAENNRVRATSPAGIISTVAGDGKAGWVTTGTPARTASIVGPAAVTIGPDGHLYMGTDSNEVLRLERNGTVTEIAGNRHYTGVFGLGGLAVKASPDDPTGLAFDRAGNLFLAGFPVKTLLMITPGGVMRAPAGLFDFYPRGEGAVVTAPNGNVYATNGESIVRLTPHGMKTVVNFTGKRFDGITGFVPQGVAVAANGTIYTDTALGNGYTNRTALIEVRPGKRPRVLWKG